MSRPADTGKPLHILNLSHALSLYISFIPLSLSLILEYDGERERERERERENWLMYRLIEEDKVVGEEEEVDGEEMGV